MLTVYLAAAYSRREELCGYRKQLAADGLGVRATWLEGPDQRLINGQLLDAATEAKIESRRFDTPRSMSYASMCAQQDLADIEAADVVVMFTGGGRGGGRHVEVGYALALGVPVLLVGARENVFHALPEIKQVATWDEAVALLAQQGRSEAS